ncbi:MAG: hypothetical protein M1824_006496 [Vezdaea acicularis]|nr:MAG: hypothetical protein M1824_006496 [Vezdaea acicularis]
MPNAINIAAYAAKRALANVDKGNLLQDMLGATGELDGQTLAIVNTWFQRATDTANGRSNSKEGLIIHCSDAYLNLQKLDEGIYVDPTNGARVAVPIKREGNKATNACGNELQAFAYTWLNGAAIVLCSDGPVGALRNLAGNSIESWRTSGDLKATSAATDKGIDYFNSFLSYKILHELMHATSLTQFNGVLPDKDPNGNVVGELYGYHQITNNPVGTGANRAPPPSANNLQHNADSFALLGVGWYLPQYAYVRGQLNRLRAANRPPDSYPNQSPASDPSPL